MADQFIASQQARPPAEETPLERLDYTLYGGVVVSWSLSWYAIILQLGVVSPEVSLVWRFTLAALIMFAWVGIRGGKLRFALAEHARFAVLGLFIFSVNFLFFYFAGSYLVSGLLSVVFSLASVFNICLTAIIFGQRPGRRTLGGVTMGIAGIALLFWPEVGGAKLDGGSLTGLALAVCGTLCFCTGNLISARLQARRIPVLSSTAWGMAYGAASMAVFAYFRGQDFIIEPTLSYLGSLAFLAVVSSVVAFTCYLTLLGRIGSGRAAYATVMFPVLALILSTFVENYTWTPMVISGLVLALAGNIVVLARSQAKSKAAAT